MATATEATTTTATTTSPASRPTTERRSSLDRELPQSLDAERAVLGSMLLDDRAASEAITILQSHGGAFFFEKNQRLFDKIVQLWSLSRPMDGVVIKDELLRDGIFDELGGYDFLGSLINSVPSALRVREYANIVREKALLRQLIGASHRVMDAAFQDKVAAQEILDFASKEIFDVTERGVSAGAHALPELIADVFRKIEAHDGSLVTGEATGYYQLDELTSGLQPGEMIVVAGRPSMGKTALGLNIAEHIALNSDHAVLFFSLEMSRQQVAQRILCSRARVDAHKLRRGQHSAQDMQRLHAAADEIRDKHLLIDDASSLSILELRARARLESRKHNLRAIFVDYLQLVRAPGQDSRQQEVAEISRGLKALAKELHLPVVAMAQLNRNPEDRSGNRPRMSDLRESGAIEQDADLISLLHREAYFKHAEALSPEDENSAELIIAKQRNGPIDTVKLHFNKMFTRFDNPEIGDRYAGAYEAQTAPDDLEFPGK